MRTTTLVFAAAVLTAASAAAQGVGGALATKVPQDQGARPKIAVAVPVRVPLEAKTVTGAPYSAEIVTETLQVLGDGNRIIRRTTGRIYRDSQGRVRREEDREPGQPGSVLVTDPVAGFAYSLDPVNKIAWKTPAGVAGGIVMKIAPGDPAEVELKRKIETELMHAAQASKAGTLQHVTEHSVDHVTEGVMVARQAAEIAAPKTEKLPARNIEGVMAEGTRTTRTIPAGAIGNEQPIVTVTEEWRSPDLQVLVLTRTSDPRTGESTYKLQNIVRGEQSRTFFEVPADYTVKESGIRHLSPTPVK